jgi:hypothetical protein
MLLPQREIKICAAAHSAQNKMVARSAELLGLLRRTRSPTDGQGTENLGDKIEKFCIPRIGSHVQNSLRLLNTDKMGLTDGNTVCTRGQKSCATVSWIRATMMLFLE